MVSRMPAWCPWAHLTRAIAPVRLPIDFPIAECSRRAQLACGADTCEQASWMEADCSSASRLPLFPPSPLGPLGYRER